MIWLPQDTRFPNIICSTYKSSPFCGTRPSCGISFPRIREAIAKRTGAKLRVRGQGSGHKEGAQNVESNEPLMLCISCPERSEQRGRVAGSPGREGDPRRWLASDLRMCGPFIRTNFFAGASRKAYGDKTSQIPLRACPFAKSASLVLRGVLVPGIDCSKCVCSAKAMVVSIVTFPRMEKFPVQMKCARDGYDAARRAVDELFDGLCAAYRTFCLERGRPEPHLHVGVQD